jgi:hypothetical protein
MATTKKTTAKKATPKSGQVTVKELAEQLEMHPKSLRRKLRNETREGQHVHKTIERGTRYAFTKQEAAAIVKRFAKKTA